ncbi:class I SAM-dependent methyltransferase [Streptomyces sp. PSKA54]|uniref:Class I SAM-dependent methyltransferase n=1 Tax=Streptomyces himalayensis subsp. aureolus TaxID=2758039 RepID=A0A7W2HJ44_9ACTN|nr:class I SAM-dependent methyltransferase [Streptomyces himalayensis]MBA4865469.1 class I SAM-dependent methyltransferase [Streptomyces himalayensis subsp. aureolus]
MDRQTISALAHGDHPIAAPLSDASVARLLERALPRAAGRLLDLGCGSGEWLLRALDGRPGLRADGVDLAAASLESARAAAERDGTGDRLTLHHQDATKFTASHAYDLVLSVGAAHAFGGLLPTLRAARGHLAPGGSVLVGDGFWEREPDRATLDAGFAADEFADLATTVDRVVADGWLPVYGHVSTLEEWDDYEWSWTGTLTRWALDHPDDPGHDDALKAANAHREAWLRGYRGTLGFVTLVLRRAADA